MQVSIQPPIICKIGSIYPSIHNKDSPNNDLSTEFSELLQKEEPQITIKFDGTCSICIKKSDDSYFLCRRQDIKINTPNHSAIKKSGESIMIGSTPAFKSIIKRGGQKGPDCEIYFFNLDTNGMPLEEGIHVIGFTPLKHGFGEDTHVINSIVGINGTDFKVWTAIGLVQNFKNKIQVQLTPIADVMNNCNILTFELMGPKVSNKYGYETNQHFIMPHGLLRTIQPANFNQETIKERIMSDDIEGFVLYFPIANKLFKINQGHLHSEAEWQKKIKCGHEFVFDM
jgi:hypothetical protein